MKLADDLRRSVLQAAIEGKLTGGKCEGWRFVRLDEICYKITDGTHTTPKYKPNGIPFLSVKDISSGKINLDNTKYISEEEHAELYKRCNPEKGDILITKVGTTGVPAIVDTDIQFSLFVSVALLKFSHDVCDVRYLYFALMSPLVQEQARKNTRGVGNKNWVLDAIKSTLIPLPPIEEQRRIVSRLDAILPLIAELESAENELADLERRFPGDMRDSLLQAAIKGRLTGSNTDNWRYVRLGDVVRVISGTSYEKHEVCREGIRIIRGGNLVDEKIVLKDDDVFLPYQYANKEKQVQQNDIVIIASTGSLKGIGRAAFVDSKFDEPIQIGAFLRIIRPVDSSLADYLKIIFAGHYYRSHISRVVNGIGIKNIREKHITEFPIPLPPIDEQHKIVTRLNELLPLCEALENLS